MCKTPPTSISIFTFYQKSKKKQKEKWGGSQASQVGRPSYLQPTVASPATTLRRLLRTEAEEKEQVAPAASTSSSPHLLPLPLSYTYPEAARTLTLVLSSLSCAATPPLLPPLRAPLPLPLSEFFFFL